jgi:hypothetical protein
MLSVTPDPDQEPRKKHWILKSSWRMTESRESFRPGCIDLVRDVMDCNVHHIDIYKMNQQAGFTVFQESSI